MFELYKNNNINRNYNIFVTKFIAPSFRTLGDFVRSHSN
ncbi:hypothetical protein F7308_0401 [Francisella salina]|uniref:Uncharacterized protein n=1 Tax=Francisella salina TaxID=573569 RepID=A0ABN3ZR35_FRAST|nr:hypothetical protein F7308_0401 [Francisella salina]